MIQEVEPRLYVCHKKLGKPFTDGFDSEVYRDGIYVTKAYKGNPSGRSKPLDEQQVNLYKDVTNSVYQMAANEGLFLNLTFSKQKLAVQINPILSVYKCDCGYMEATSLYVGGPNLEEIPYKIDPKELVTSLRDLSSRLENKFGVTGVSLAPINIKFLDEKTLMVTDVCADVSSLRQKKFF